MITTIHASAHDLRGVKDRSVQLIATSPPYYGLRSYAGDQDVEWPSVTFRLNEWCEPVTVPPMRCALGLEDNPVAYIGHLILCLREWRRVLRDDGVCFVNLGDSYARAGGWSDNSGLDGLPRGASGRAMSNIPQNGKASQGLAIGLKPKDLLGIPWLFAIAARADGWWLRSDIIWAKPNPMPESVTDRPTKAHEYVFLLAKGQRYYWDADAVREEIKLHAVKSLQSTPGDPTEKDIQRREMAKQIWGANGNQMSRSQNQIFRGYTEIKGANIRTVWNIATQPYAAAHYAVWPERLVEPMVKAASKPGDTVLDPFAGSGTTGRVAVRLGRQAILVDVSAEYLANHVPARTTVQMELLA